MWGHVTCRHLNKQIKVTQCDRCQTVGESGGRAFACTFLELSLDEWVGESWTKGDRNGRGIKHGTGECSSTEMLAGETGEHR